MDPILESLLERLDQNFQKVADKITATGDTVPTENYLIGEKTITKVLTSINLPQLIEAYNDGSGNTNIIYTQYKMTDDDRKVVKNIYTNIVSTFVVIAVVSLLVYHFKYYLFYFFKSKKNE